MLKLYLCGICKQQVNPNTSVCHSKFHLLCVASAVLSDCVGVCRTLLWSQCKVAKVVVLLSVDMAWQWHFSRMLVNVALGWWWRVSGVGGGGRGSYLRRHTKGNLFTPDC